MLGKKNAIKTPILLQMTVSRRFLSFQIIMIVIIMTEHSQIVLLVPRIPKTYNMLGMNYKNAIKTPILLQMVNSRTFLSFLIIMMVIIMTLNVLNL